MDFQGVVFQSYNCWRNGDDWPFCMYGTISVDVAGILSYKHLFLMRKIRQYVS